MEEHTIEVTIARNGEVKVHVKGATGQRCLSYIELLKQAVGRVKELQRTHEYYREGKVRVDAEDAQRVSDSEGEQA